MNKKPSIPSKKSMPTKSVPRKEEPAPPVVDEQFKAITKSFLVKHQIQIVVDAGCNEVKNMPAFGLTNYYGMDIDSAKYKKNAKHMRHGVSFHIRNIISDLLPQADMIMCDCIAHFSDEDAIKTILNFKHSNAKYLLLPTEIGKKATMKMPEPIETVGNMSLWRAEDIPEKLAVKKK